MVKLRYKGFTLVELVLVIVLLGIVGVGVTSFIGLSTQIYGNVTARDALIANGRFVIERLNRELRQALPNSIRVNQNATTQCIEFVPIRVSGSYQDLPVSPESAASQVSLIADPDGALPSPLYAAAYVLNPNEVYSASSKVFEVSTVSAPASLGLWTINLTAAITFAADSPTERLYLVSEPVSYCISAGRLNRFEGYGFNVIQALPPASTGVLMAEDIDTSAGVANFFSVNAASQQRNSLITIGLSMQRNGESIFIGNEVQVVNVP